ncbi:hypothetical protein [Catellatospora citrea]|uniref:Uncharacterized protein n=1 Tax=Catellatospora citrea TaxID=53366 RepID=A0A8J3KD90_9ACTN|nr:hypothetical protein [Catellatospora citrea]GIF97537.1 hypothetical protein Cci01nite_26310 [Catellatospora citrea]
MGYSGFVIIARIGDTRFDEPACVDDLLVAGTDNVSTSGATNTPSSNPWRRLIPVAAAA